MKPEAELKANSLRSTCAPRLNPTAALKTPKHRASRPVAPSPAPRPPGRYVLRLFVAGATARSHQAVLRVRELCDAQLKGRCQLEVIDIYQQPELARVNQIVATPTLVMEFPRPVRRFVGNLANLAILFDELDLTPEGNRAL